jgi:hypothetical protein
LPATTVVPPRGSAFAGLSPPAAVSPPLTAASPGVPSLSEKPASPTLGPFAVPPHSWAKVVVRKTLPVGSPPFPPDHPLSDPANAWSPAGFRRGRERKEGWDDDPFGQPRPSQGPLNGTQTSPGRNSPSRAQNRTLGLPKPSIPTVIPPRRGLRALLAPTPPQADCSVSPQAAADIQKVLFAAPATTPASAAMETEDAPQSTSKKADEVVTYLYEECLNFSAAARKEPREARRLLLLAQSKADSQRLRPLDILHSSRDLHSRVSATCLSGGPSAFCDRHSPPSDRSGGLSPTGHCVLEQPYRRAPLLCFSPELREDFLFSLWNDVQNSIRPPPSKYKNLQWIVKQNLLEFNLLFGQTEY